MYTIQIRAISYGKVGRELELTAPTYTDDVTLQTETNDYAPEDVKLWVRTVSGVGDRHEVLIDSLNMRVVPRKYTFPTYSTYQERIVSSLLFRPPFYARSIIFLF